MVPPALVEQIHTKIIMISRSRRAGRSRREGRASASPEADGVDGSAPSATACPPGPLRGHAATPPALVSYQGFLRDGNDDPPSGSFDMAFTIYDAPTGGNWFAL